MSSHYHTLRQAPAWHTRPATWPTGAATVAVDGVAARRAGSLPVWLGAVAAKPSSHADVGNAAAAPANQAPSRVRVAVASAKTSETLGVNGVVLSVRPTAGTGDTRVSLGYGSFADAFGGGWASRLHLVELPACALTTPADPACRTETPLPATNDSAAATVTADLTLRSTVVLAATAATGGAQGDFAATSLKPASSWQSGDAADSFTYSYPVDVPPVPGGLAPDVTLAYNSQSVDGLTSATNNQASSIGDGWTYDPGYIERSYSSCADIPAITTKTGDNCWSANNTLTLSLGGRTTQLIKDDATGTYHPQNDEHERVQFLTGAANGAQNGEYFVVTTTDGTQYFYGKNELPGWGPGEATTNSVWTEPVFATAAGQPCFAATFADSWCQQAYRWNLDYVVDPHHDTVSYFYDTETNFYARDNGATANTSYVRAGRLAKIEYGQRDGAVYSTPPAGQVVFTSTGRCDQSTCDPVTLTTATAPHWPDVPFDLNCANGSACTNNSPSFWSEYALSSIQTTSLVGTTQTNVDSWTFDHTFPDPGDTTPGTTDTGTTPSLWLSAIHHTGQDTTAGAGGPASVPALTFGSQELANRVDLGKGYPPLTRPRLSQIETETGELVSVDYSAPDCGAGAPTVPSQNTALCYPAYWTPPDQPAPIMDWFNKYIVTEVTQEDPTGGSAEDTIETHYTPVGTPAWHFDDNPLTKTSQRTWNDWRGYGGMIVSTGKAPDPVTKTQYSYFRGMDGDTLPGGATRHATVTDSRSDPAVTDANQFEGEVYETTTFNGTAVVTDTVDTPYASAATATQAHTGLPSAQAFVTGLTSTKVYTPLASGSTRTTEIDYTHDTVGRVTATNDLGDISTSTDDLCTTTTFADNTTAWILDKPADARTVSVACGTASPPNSAVVSDERTFYDSTTTLGATPTAGDVTETEDLVSFTGTTPNYATTTDTYDEYGRQLSETNPDNDTSGTAYTPLTGAEPTQTVDTDALGHATTTTLDPLRDLTLSTKDAAGFVTAQQFDALGRLTQVSKPGLSAPALKYTYTVSDTGPSVVDTETLDPDGTYRLSETLYDSMLRERETQTQVPDLTPDDMTDNPRTVTDTIYNSDGWAGETIDPYANGLPVSPTLVQAQVGDEPSATQTLYDGAGRKTADVSLAGGLETWRTSYTYGGDFTTTVPPAGGTVETTFTDARGNTSDLYQYHTGVPADPLHDPAADYSDTHYTYTPANKQASVVDPAGNTWSYAYDLLGNQTSSTDPDAGTTISTYSAAGLALTTTDARGKQITTQYDKGGRKTGQFDTTGGAATSADQIAAWTYDTTAIGSGPAKAVGYLTSTTSTSGGDTDKQTIRQYDDQAQPVSVTTTLTGTDAALVPTAGLTVGYTYSLTGYLTAQNDPAAGNLPSESMTIGYDQFGQPISLKSGANAIVSAVGYTQLGQPAQYTVPATAGDLALNLSYDRQTQAVTEVKATDVTQTAAVVDDLTYRYGGNGVSKGSGLVTSVTDSQDAGAVMDTQCFTYDYAGHLGQAWTGTDACATTPSTGDSATVGGPNPYWQSWTYDAAGDRLTEVDHDTAGTTANDTSVAYHYPAASSATDQPHTVTGTTATGPQAAQQTAGYTYDPAGNTTAITGGALGNQTMTWDDQGNLATDATPAGTTAYAYDADGNLLVQRDPTKTTLYLADEQLVRNDNSGVVNGTRYYTVGDTTIASRNANMAPTYLLPDRQGTDEVAIDSGTHAVTRRQFLPFGQARGTVPGAWPGGAKSYVGGTLDSATGLENLGAREYDPDTGRFLSADPVFEAADPTQMAGYDYAGNNPTTHEDPTGQFFFSCGAADCGPDSSKAGTTPTPPKGSRNGEGGISVEHIQSWNNKQPPVVHHRPAPKPVAHTSWFGRLWDGAVHQVRKAAHWVGQHRATIVHFAVSTAVGVGAGLLAGVVCGATAGLGCLAVAGALIGGLGSGLANVGAARLMHEKVTNGKVIKWTLSGVPGGAIRGLRGGLELGGMKLGGLAAGAVRAGNASILTNHLNLAWTIFRTKGFW